MMKRDCEPGLRLVEHLCGRIKSFPSVKREATFSSFSLPSVLPRSPAHPSISHFLVMQNHDLHSCFPLPSAFTHVQISSVLKNAASAIISRLATSFFLFLATTFWTSMVCTVITSVAFQSTWVWFLVSSTPLKLLPKVTIELQDTQSNRCLSRVLPPTHPSIAHTPSGTSQSPGGCSPFWLLYHLGFWVPDSPVGVLRGLTKSLLSHPVFSLCHSFNGLLCSEDSPALLRLSPTFYQTQLHSATRL